MHNTFTHQRFSEEMQSPSAAILIVEDSKGLNRLIQKHLSREGFQTIQALTGTEALAAIEAHPVDLMLLDYALPDMNAPQILEALTQRGDKVPFVMMTGQGDERVAVAMMKSGAQDYIVKQGNFIEILPEVIKRVRHDIAREQALMEADANQRKLEYVLRETLEHMQQISVMLNTDGKMTFCNEFLLRLTGWTLEEVLGTDWFQRFLPSDTRPVANAMFLRAIQSGELPPHHENEIVTKHGERCLIRWTNITLRDSSGAVIGTHSLGEDITERKRIEKTLLQLQKAVETMHLGVTITDVNRKIVYTNPADAAMHGYTPDELLGRDAGLLAPPEFRRPIQLEEIETTRNWVRESLNIRKDGSRFPVQLCSDVVRDPDGNAIAMVTACEDITERKRAEEMLRQDRNLLRTLIDNIPDHIFVKDTEGRFLLNNLAHVRFLGAQTPEELIGSSVFDYLPPELAGPYHASDQAVLDTGSPIVNDEEPSLSEKGQPQWLLTTKLPLRDSQGNITNLVGISRNITDQKRSSEALKASQKFLLSTIDALKSHIAILDEQGTILEVNASWRQFAEEIGLPAENYGIGKHYVKVYATVFGESSPEVLELERGIAKVLEQTHDEFYYECLYQGRTKPRWFAIRVTCFRSGETIRAVISHENISERCFAEEALKRTLENLERRVQERTEELSATNVMLQQQIADRLRAEADLQCARDAALKALLAAEAASSAKSDFLSNMSHDLRTPLNAILGYTQILQGEGDIPQRHQKALTTIQRSGEHLLNLIKDVLDLAKIEAGCLDLQNDEVSLLGILSTVSDMIRVKAEQKGLVFEHEYSPTLPDGIIVDGKRLREILLNLLGNGVKFTEQGTVSLRVSESETPLLHQRTDSTTLRFEVNDSGIGISGTQLEDIFAPFQQAGEQSYRMQGTGLGLAISRHLVELMDGVLHVQSTPGHGSLFWFEIPVRVVSGRIPSTIPPKAPKIVNYLGPRRRMLIVDDQPTNREVLRSMLEPIGFIVFEAENGQEGLNLYFQEAPDAVLLDLFMPRMDGFELMQRIREQGVEEQQHSVLIAVSASVSDDIRQQSLKAGCEEFLPKPFQLHLLLELLQRHLNLEWILEAGAETDEGRACSGHDVEQMLLRIPAEDRQQLLLQARRGNVKALLSLLDQIERHDAQLRPVTTMLRKLAEGFQVDRLAELLKRIEK